MQGENSEKENGRARSLANLEQHKFKPGQSGNPAGRPKSALVSTALRLKLNEPVPDDPLERTYAEVIAAELVDKAAKGDVRAIQEVVDRVEGKARQTVTLTVERKEVLERAVRGIMEEARCTRDEAIASLSIFHPDVLTLSQN